MIHLGVDTLCWHLRLERGGVTLEEVLEQAAGLGAAFVQVNLHHVRGRYVDELRALAARADELGPRLLASGDFLGEGRALPAVDAAGVALLLENHSDFTVDDLAE